MVQKKKKKHQNFRTSLSTLSSNRSADCTAIHLIAFLLLFSQKKGNNYSYTYPLSRRCPPICLRFHLCESSLKRKAVFTVLWIRTITHGFLSETSTSSFHIGVLLLLYRCVFPQWEILQSPMHI